MIADTQTGYECFDELTHQLRAEGCEETAGKLHALLHETAWTTSSELLGELGLAILDFERSVSAVSPELKRRIETCMSLVRRAWPQIGNGAGGGS